MVKRCVKCNSFQKKETVMVEVNGKQMCPACYAKYMEANKVEVISSSKIENVLLLDSKKLISEEIIIPGRQGITNFQMIPVIKKAVDENDFKVVKFMKDMYQNVFESTFKYIGKKRQQKLNALNII